MGLIKGPAGVRLAASGPAFIDGLGHLVVKADRALGPSLGRGRPVQAGTGRDLRGPVGRAVPAARTRDSRCRRRYAIRLISGCEPYPWHY